MIPSINDLFEMRSGTICVFDIDDTLIFSDSKIYYTEPGKEKKGVSTTKFADIRQDLDPNTIYDFQDFEEFDKILVGIKWGRPNIPILKILDKAIQAGNKIGIITARGNQDAIWRGLNSFLLYRGKDDKLQPLPKNQFNKSYVFAVGDSDTLRALKIKGGSENPSAVKAHVLQKIFGDKYGFKTIIFYDDDIGNIKAIEDLKDPRITAVKV